MKQTPEQWAGLVRRLNDGGCPVLPDHGYKVSPVGLAIEKIPCTSFSSIFDLQQGGTGFAIELTLRNEAPRPINIVGYQIRTPWGIPMLSLLPAPKRSSARYPHYCFPEPGPYYEGDWVINRYFARRKSQLQPGEQIEGVLVASSEEMIPLDIPHLARIVVTLYVFDRAGTHIPHNFGYRNRGADCSREADPSNGLVGTIGTISRISSNVGGDEITACRNAGNTVMGVTL